VNQNYECAYEYKYEYNYEYDYDRDSGGGPSLACGVSSGSLAGAAIHPPWPPLCKGGKGVWGGMRLLMALRSDQRLGCDFACAPLPPAPLCKGGKGCAGLRLLVAFRTEVYQCGKVTQNLPPTATLRGVRADAER
jgi:hypothetical protein